MNELIPNINFIFHIIYLLIMLLLFLNFQILNFVPLQTDWMNDLNFLIDNFQILVYDYTFFRRLFFDIILYITDLLTQIFNKADLFFLIFLVVQHLNFKVRHLDFLLLDFLIVHNILLSLLFIILVYLTNLLFWNCKLQAIKNSLILFLNRY